MRFASNDSCFANLEISETAFVTVENYLNVGKMQSDVETQSDSMLLNSLNVNGYSFSISGDVTVTGNVSVTKGMLKMDGDLKHTGGTIVLNKGHLKVTGDYGIQSVATDSAGDLYYTTYTGCLVMQCEEDKSKRQT